MKKKIVAMCATVAIAALAVGGTLAYFTDTEKATNIMTYGNVSIVQTEMERVDGVAYNAELKDGDLQKFTQNQKVYPAVLKGEGYELTQDKANGIKWGSYVYSGTAWSTIYNPEQVDNAIDKFVFVENTGSEAVYFRTVVAVECPEGWEVGHCGEGDEIGVIFGGQYDCVSVGKANGYEYFVLTYKEGLERVLESGKQAHPSLLQLVLNAKLDNADMAKLGDTFEVKVMTQAVQAEGFDDMEQALEKAFGALDAEKAAALF